MEAKREGEKEVYILNMHVEDEKKKQQCSVVRQRQLFNLCVFLVNLLMIIMDTNEQKER